MKKLIGWCKDNILGLITLFLLAFIPLYPKLPLVDIKNTWVYVRVEDFYVFGALLVWGILFFRKKVTLNTPLTLPILGFWLIGVLATIHGVLLIFPTVANVFPNVALLSFIRRIEYMSLFFIAFSSVRGKWLLPWASVVLMVTLFLVSVYGIGQKYFSLPAYLTMNEEFAKGVPIQLSALSRVPSTFAGHYDFAAFLVLVIPIAVSLLLSVKSWFLKAILLIICGLGSFALVMTVSRISLVALVLSLGMLFATRNRKFILYMIPIIIISFFAFIRLSPTIIDRITSTVKQVDLLVSATNGAPIGKVSIVPKTYFEGKIVKQEFFRSTAEANNDQITGKEIVIPYTDLPDEVVLLATQDAPTGEDLPQGTGYINLTLSPVIRKLNNFFYEVKSKGSEPTEVQIINGPYIIKRTLAYDVSFTTRFQGEWPNAIAAFKRNILLGSGYGSVSLAVDNSYLRMLGEVGIAGFLAFAAIFVCIGVYIKKVWPSIDSPLVKSITLGGIAGFFGLLVNALFIDVFEASKIAFVLWIMVGLIVGTLGLYSKSATNFYNSILRIVSSVPAVVIMLIIMTMVLYGQLSRNYFTGDDFTWLRWAAESKLSDIPTYFTDAAGFFYRPGAKLYFSFMYNVFWLNQSMYHIVSLILHCMTVVLAFFLARKIFGRTLFALLTAMLFILMSGYGEAVFWVSATGFLFATNFALGSLLSYIRWEDSGKFKFFVIGLLCSLVAPLFHELGIVAPLLFLSYQFVLAKPLRFITLIPIPIYLMARYAAGSHWFSGDYNYNLLKLPFNALGNVLGYMLTMPGGSLGTSVYMLLRNVLREHLVISLLLVGALGIVIIVFRRSIRISGSYNRKVLGFSAAFFIIALLPFLGLGNISPRYGYMASIGLAIGMAYVIQKMYTHLLPSGKQVSRAIVVLGLGIFSLFQVIQIMSLHDNWHEAGEKVQKFIVSIDGAFEDTWRERPMEFHFVNVPIRAGEAWIFPVGLNDALWFVTQNPNLRIFQDATVEEALAVLEYESPTQKVFLFDETGAVSEKKKVRSVK